MTKAVASVTPAVPSKQAANVLIERGFTALPVVNEAGELIGIVTEADLIRDRFPDDPSATSPGMTVGDVMTSPAVGVNHDSDVTVLAKAMLTEQRRCLPIVDGTTLVGVVTRRDIVRALAKSDADIAVEVRRRLQVLGGQSRWSIQVDNGDVVVTDQFHDASDRAVAQVLTESVIGVIRATITTSAKPAEKR
ncbi:MAG: CBS domain-containing protein [Nakamurella sp.]